LRMKNNKHTQNSPIRGISLTPEEIVFLSAEANYTQIHYLNGRRTVYARTLKSIESQIKKAGFFRTHKSFLVNLNFLKEVHWNAENPFMVLSNDYRVSISRRKRLDLRKRLNEIPMYIN
jgi:two-component system, LytTR family, response regulator